MTNLDGYRPLQHPPSSSAMAPKGHRAGGGLTRTHSRSSSGGGGGGKLGLNLQLTQKDPGPSRYPDKPRRNNHLENARGSGNVSRTSSSSRINSKEHVNPSAIRRAPVPRVSSKHKVGFSISSPSEEGDDDEWVSSESGAATPLNDSDTEDAVTPIEKSKPQLPHTIVTNGFTKDEQPTPRAEPPSLPRVETVRPENGKIPGPLPTSRDYAPPPEIPTPTEPIPQQQQQFVPPPRTPSPRVASPAPKARSETHSPPRRLSPDVPKRAMTRPPSSQSIASTASHALRPHPLIRAHSHSHGALQSTSRPVPLAPLTTSDQIPGQLPNISPTSYRASSPTSSIHHAAASPVISQPSPTGSEASRQLRRTSTSSRSSTATVDGAMRPSASHSQLGRTANHDRQRTLSSSSTLAALSSFNLSIRPSPSPPKIQPQHFVVRLPSAENQTAEFEAIHSVLPAPYAPAHLTVLTYRNPLAESYDRVVRAKQTR